MKQKNINALFACVIGCVCLSIGCQGATDKATIDAAPPPPANAKAPAVNPNKPQPVGGSDGASGEAGSAAESTATAQ